MSSPNKEGYQRLLVTGQGNSRANFKSPPPRQIWDNLNLNNNDRGLPWQFHGRLPSNSEGVVSVSCQAAEILHASRPKNQNLKQKQCYNKFSKWFAQKNLSFFWLCWVFVAVHRLSLVVVCRLPSTVASLAA